MKVDVYRAKKSPGSHENLYIFIPSGSNVDHLPPEILKQTGELSIEKTIDIQPGEKRIALNSDEALKNIREHGYHLQGSKIEFEIRVGSSKI